MAVIERFIRRGFRKTCVIEADHIIAEGDHSLPGEADAACGNAAILAVGHATILPVTVRIENGRERTFAVA